MALTDSQVKERILLLVGDVDVDGNPVSDERGIIISNIDLIWETYDGYSQRLRELYARRDCILAIISKIGLTADTSIGRDLGLSIRKSDRTKYYLELLDRTYKEITSASVVIATGIAGTGILGELTRVSPVLDDERLEFLANLR